MIGPADPVLNFGQVGLFTPAEDSLSGGRFSHAGDFAEEPVSIAGGELCWFVDIDRHEQLSIVPP